jgi:hypothetical protein
MILSETERMIKVARFASDGWLHIQNIKLTPGAEIVKTLSFSIEDQEKLVKIILEKQQFLQTEDKTNVKNSNNNE